MDECPGGRFSKGDIVATAMGGLGRQRDGGYAEYTVSPASQVKVCSSLWPNTSIDVVNNDKQTPLHLATKNTYFHFL